MSRINGMGLPNLRPVAAIHSRKGSGERLTSSARNLKCGSRTNG